MKLVKPIFTVGKQEMHHLILTIIEAERVPLIMLTTVSWIEILIWIATEIAKSFILILHGM